MKVTTLDENAIHDIGHAFGYYDYGQETGMTAVFSGKAATEAYICTYVRGMLRGGFLHTTSQRGEGYIAYKLPKETLGFKTMWPIAQGDAAQLQPETAHGLRCGHEAGRNIPPKPHG